MQSFKIIDYQEFGKIMIEEKIEREVKRGVLREKWTTFSITVNKYLLPLQSNFVVGLKVGFHFIS